MSRWQTVILTNLCFFIPNTARVKIDHFFIRGKQWTRITEACGQRLGLALCTATGSSADFVENSINTGIYCILHMYIRLGIWCFVFKSNRKWNW